MKLYTKCGIYAGYFNTVLNLSVERIICQLKLWLRNSGNPDLVGAAHMLGAQIWSPSLFIVFVQLCVWNDQIVEVQSTICKFKKEEKYKSQGGL